MTITLDLTPEQESNLQRRASIAGFSDPADCILAWIDQLALPEPPNTIRDQAHLEELLLEGLDSPTHLVTEDTWEDIRHEVNRRYHSTNQNGVK